MIVLEWMFLTIAPCDAAKRSNLYCRDYGCRKNDSQDMEIMEDRQVELEYTMDLSNDGNKASKSDDKIIREKSNHGKYNEAIELSNQYRVDYTRYLKLQDSILRQNARVKWIQEDDVNIAYFHAIIKGRRRRLSIKKIMDEQDQWIEGNDAIVKAAVRYYQKIFTPENQSSDFDVLNCLERCINEEDNDLLTTTPTMQEVKDCVIFIDPDSAPGPDGLSIYFYQKSWHIIAHDLYKAMVSFFCGATLPKYFTHTCI
uniref:Reverse transcriptase n=1 Tax=Nicotiana tabacum TaxID=4097 RepID=A0A1S4C8K2_TOBAC|nr:PREDICTED: uncharacterized protein LOC107816119 [Nicotiana tabacum]